MGMLWKGLFRETANVARKQLCLTWATGMKQGKSRGCFKGRTQRMIQAADSLRSCSQEAAVQYSPSCPCSGAATARNVRSCPQPWTGWQSPVLSTHSPADTVYGRVSGGRIREGRELFWSLMVLQLTDFGYFWQMHCLTRLHLTAARPWGMLVVLRRAGCALNTQRSFRV